MSNSVDPMLVMEYMEYGSLYDLLHNETMEAGGEIILQIIRDIVQGIQFLHASKPPILHGDLKAKNVSPFSFKPLISSSNSLETYIA